MNRKHTARQQIRQQRQREGARRQETVRSRDTTTGYASRPPISVWTIAAIALALIGLIAFIVLERQVPANSAYPPVGTISCDGGEHADLHIHAHLTLYINGHKSVAPAGVGIAPDTSCFYWLHTHNTDGVIHIEAPSGRTFTLKNFLDIWSSHFATLGYPSQLNQTTGWLAYVDGKPFAGDFRTIPLRAHTLITLVYNSPGAQPDTSFAWNGL